MISIDRLLVVAQEAAQVGGDVLIKGFRKLLKHQVSLKGAGDYVTEMDHRSEEAVIERIRRSYRDHRIHAEESGLEPGPSEYRWFVDPLDGTANYVHGVPFFCVSVAVARNGEVLAGAVFDPAHKEMYWATKGGGAYLNGNPIFVSEKTKLAEAYLASGFPWRSKPYLEAYLGSFRELFSICSGVRRMGAAAMDLSYTACGRFDGFWEMKLKPWDMAAGVLLVDEAGGAVSDFRGGRGYMESGNLLAANARIFPDILHIVKRHLGDVA